MVEGLGYLVDIPDHSNIRSADERVENFLSQDNKMQGGKPCTANKPFASIQNQPKNITINDFLLEIWRWYSSVLIGSQVLRDTHRTLHQ